MTIESFEPVSSSQIASAEYDTDTNELSVTFTSGSTYIYSRVPRGIFDGLRAADSPGSFWNRQKGQFPYRRAG